MADGTDIQFTRVKRLSEQAGLPGIEEGTSYGNPALKVGGKSFVTVKDEATLVIPISIDDKERLIEMAPHVYFQTAHYVGWPYMPLRAEEIDDIELTERLIGAWLFRAPKRLSAIFRRPR